MTMRDAATDYKPEPIDFEVFILSRGFKPSQPLPDVKTPMSITYERGTQRIAITFARRRDQLPAYLRGVPKGDTPFVSYFHAGTTRGLLVRYQQIPFEKLEADRLLNMLAEAERVGYLTVTMRDLKTGEEIQPTDTSKLSEKTRKRIASGLRILGHEPSTVSPETWERIARMFHDSDYEEFKLNTSDAADVRRTGFTPFIYQYPPCQTFATPPAQFDFLGYLKEYGFTVNDVGFAWSCHRGKQRILVSRLFAPKFFHAGVSGDDVIFYQTAVPKDALEADRVIAALDARLKKDDIKRSTIHKLTTDYPVVEHSLKDLKTDCGMTLKSASPVDQKRAEQAIEYNGNYSPVVTVPAGSRDNPSESKFQDRICFFCHLLDRRPGGRVSYWEGTELGRE